jgi:hypothetical protein
VPPRSRLDTTALEVLAAAQHRCVSLEQLAGVGMSSASIAYRTRPRGGSWTRLLPGVVMLHTGTPTADERAVAALLYAGREGALLTGTESLRRQGVRRLPPGDPVHVLIPHDRRRVSAGFVVCERSRRLPQPVAGLALPCTPVARALVDAARRMPRLDAVQAVAADAVQRRLCPQAQLLTEVRQAQIRGTARIRVVADEIIGGIRSVAEADAKRLMERGGLPPALWNHDVVTPTGDLVGCPDAWFDEEAVAVEVDSREWHLEPRGWERTQVKRARFARYGITTVPWTPRGVRERPHELVEELRATLDAARARPRPDVLAVLRSQAA